MNRDIFRRQTLILRVRVIRCCNGRLENARIRGNIDEAHSRELLINIHIVAILSQLLGEAIYNEIVDRLLFEYNHLQHIIPIDRILFLEGLLQTTTRFILWYDNNFNHVNARNIQYSNDYTPEDENCLRWLAYRGIPRWL